MSVLKACIFDLDGVVVDTAKFHFIAWREVARSLGFDFTHEENEKLKGISRMESLELILKWGGVAADEATKMQLATRKNEHYLHLCSLLKPDEAIPGVIDFIRQLRSEGVKIALGSASKNATFILEKLEILALFDAIVDGTRTTKGKPDPQVFLLAAEDLGIDPTDCVVFEDAEAGIEAALAAGMLAIGVGDPSVLTEAHQVIQDFRAVTLAHLHQWVAARGERL
jgi:beta-phosphoglucomutase